MFYFRQTEMQSRQVAQKGGKAPSLRREDMVTYHPAELRNKNWVKNKLNWDLTHFLSHFSTFLFFCMTCFVDTATSQSHTSDYRLYSLKYCGISLTSQH